MVGASSCQFLEQGRRAHLHILSVPDAEYRAWQPTTNVRTVVVGQRLGSRPRRHAIRWRSLFATVGTLPVGSPIIDCRRMIRLQTSRQHSEVRQRRPGIGASEPDTSAGPASELFATNNIISARGRRLYRVRPWHRLLPLQP